MKAAFKGIRFSLMVGIGSGIPSADVDIRLGDVVISQPDKTFWPSSSVRLWQNDAKRVRQDRISQRPSADIAQRDGKDVSKRVSREE